MNKLQTKVQPGRDLLKFYTELFDYNMACNDTIFLLLIEHEDKFSERVVPLVNHIVNLHHLWNNRIESLEVPNGVWEIHKFKELLRINHNNHERSRNLMINYSPEQEVFYVSHQGIKYKNTVQDILFHIINHSTHHRAQLVVEMKKSGIDPPTLDYIFYKRES